MGTPSDRALRAPNGAPQIDADPHDCRPAAAERLRAPSGRVVHHAGVAGDDHRTRRCGRAGREKFLPVADRGRSIRDRRLLWPVRGGIRMAAQAFYAPSPRLYKRGRQLALDAVGRGAQMLALQSHMAES